MMLFLSSDARGCFEEARRFVDNNSNSDSVASAVDQLLTTALTIDQMNAQHHPMISEIASFIEDISFMHPNVTMVLLEHMQSMQHPQPFLDVLASIVSRASADQLDNVALKLFEMAKTESLLVQVLSMLSDLPLNAQLVDTRDRAIVDTLRTVSAEDFPLLFKASLKCCATKYAPLIAHSWRDGLDAWSPTELTAVLEIIFDSLPLFEKFGLEWLEQLNQDLRLDGSHLSAADLCVILISFSGQGSAQLARKSKLLLQSLIRAQRLPVHVLTALPSVECDHAVWRRLHAPLWQLCLWLMDPASGLLQGPINHQHHVSEGNTETWETAPASQSEECNSLADAATSSSSGLLSILAPLVVNLYQAALTLRDGVSFSLITQCFPQVQGSTKAYLSSKPGKAPIVMLPKLGQAHAALSQVEGPSRARGRTFKEVRMYRRQQGRMQSAQRQLAYNRAIVAVNVLHALCSQESCTKVREAVLQALLNRVYQQVPDTDKIFPSPAIMHRLLECAVMGASQHENTLLIQVQKLLATASTNDASVVSSFFSSRPLSLDTLRGSGFINTALSRAQAPKRLSPALPLQAYSPTTLGILLAGHLLLRREASSEFDAQKMLNLVTRSDPVFQGPSALYAVDMLTTCCYSAYLRVTEASTTVPSTFAGSSSSGAAATSAFSTSFAASIAPSRNADYLKHAMLSLQTVLDKLVKSVLTRPRTSDRRNLDYCVIQLKDPVEQPPRNLSEEQSAHWPLVQLCASTVNTSASDMLARSVGPEHIAHALQESIAISSTLYHLVERLSFANSVLASARDALSRVSISNIDSVNGTSSLNTTGTVLSSVSSTLPAVRISLLRDETAVSRRYADFEGDDEVEDPVAEAAPSTAFLTKWSGEAAEAFSGEFELKPELMSTAQALKLAWERGLIVAMFVGHSQVRSGSHSHLLTLKLLCQLHACRLMLRAAHSKHMGYKQRETTLAVSKRRALKAKALRTAEASKKRKSRSGYDEGSFVGAGYGSKRSPSGSSSAAQSRRETESVASAQIRNEFSEELQCTQRMSLQRLLTRSMQRVPVSQLLSCLSYILRLENGTASISAVSGTPSRSAASAQPAIPAGLLTDSGLAIVSQLVHRVALRRVNTEQRVNADDYFVSFHEALSEPTEEEQEGDLLDELLCYIPALLGRIERARLNFDEIYSARSPPTQKGLTSASSGSKNKRGGDGQSRSASSNENSVDAMQFVGKELRSDGLKLLALTLFALLELRCPALIHKQARASVASLELVAAKCQEHTRISMERHSFLSIPTAPPSSSTSTLSTNSQAASIQQACACALATIYNTMEKLILEQHDCAVVTSGLRALHALVPRGSAAALDCRFSSIGWFCFRNIFTESTSLAVHLLPAGNEVVPGMDDNWPLLARVVAAQASLPAVLQEVHRRVTKKTECVLSLFRPCFDTKPDFHSPRMVTHQHDQLSIAAYRQFWQVWWASELPANRVYGVALIVREVFRTMFSESSEAASSAQKKKLNTEHHVDSDESEYEQDSKSNSLTVPASKVKSGARLAPEHLLTKDFSQGAKVRGTFPFLMSGMEDFHLQVALPLLPVLFLLSTPNADDALVPVESEFGKNLAQIPLISGPYRNFVQVCMLFNWTMQCWLRVLADEHEHLRILIQLAPQLVRVCRATLAAVEAAVNHAVHWRSEQKPPRATDDRPGSSASSAVVIDVGAVKYLKVMLSWALSVTQEIGNFARLFKEIIVQTNEFDIPRMLVSSIPSLETYAERYSARLFLISEGHSLRISPKDVHNLTAMDYKQQATGSKAQSNADVLAPLGDKEMYTRMVQFLERHHAAVLTPLDSTAFTVGVADSCAPNGGGSSMGRDRGVSSRGAGGAYAGASYDDDSEAESEDFEFAALTSRRKRGSFGVDVDCGGDWGLYSSPSGEQSVTSASSSMGDDTADGNTEISEGGLWTDDAGSVNGADGADDSFDFGSDEDEFSDE